MLESVFVSRPAARIHFVDLPLWLRRRIGGDPAAHEEPQEQERILSALTATNSGRRNSAGSSIGAVRRRSATAKAPTRTTPPTSRTPTSGRGRA